MSDETLVTIYSKDDNDSVSIPLNVAKQSLVFKRIIKRSGVDEPIYLAFGVTMATFKRILPWMKYYAKHYPDTTQLERLKAFDPKTSVPDAWELDFLNGIATKTLFTVVNATSIYTLDIPFLMHLMCICCAMHIKDKSPAEISEVVKKIKL